MTVGGKTLLWWEMCPIYGMNIKISILFGGGYSIKAEVEAYGKQCKAKLCKSIENDEKRQSVRSLESGCEENGGKAAENPGDRKTVDSKRTSGDSGASEEQIELLEKKLEEITGQIRVSKREDGTAVEQAQLSDAAKTLQESKKLEEKRMDRLELRADTRRTLPNFYEPLEEEE